jgi:hypothetical protein
LTTLFENLKTAKRPVVPRPVVPFLPPFFDLNNLSAKTARKIGSKMVDYRPFIWKALENFVPLHCQREKAKFAVQAGDKNYRARRQLLPRQSQKRSLIGDTRK